MICPWQDGQDDGNCAWLAIASMREFKAAGKSMDEWFEALPDFMRQGFYYRPEVWAAIVVDEEERFARVAGMVSDAA